VSCLFGLADWNPFILLAFKAAILHPITCQKTAARNSIGPATGFVDLREPFKHILPSTYGVYVPKRAGIRNVRAAGKQLGRPVRIVDREHILRLRAEGVSIEEIAAKLGVGYGTVRKRLAQAS